MKNPIRLAAALAALALASCSTYTSVAYTDWTANQAAISKVTSQAPRQSDPATTVVESFHLGGEPTLVLRCTAPFQTKLRVETETTTYRSRRRAEATLLVKNATNENLLVYGLGLAVLAPVWVPFLYQGDAGSAAEEAKDGSTGLRTVESGDNECVVSVTEEREIDPDKKTSHADEFRTGTAPVANAVVRVRVGGQTFERTTDHDGRLAVPLRAVIERSGAPTFAVITQPRTAIEQTTEVSLVGGKVGASIANAVAMFIRPATLSTRPDVSTDAPPPIERLARTATRAADRRARWDAARQLPHLVALNGGHPPVPETARRAYVDAERGIGRHDTFKKTLAALDRTLASAPWWSQVHELRARVARTAGKHAESLGSLARAHALAPAGSERATDLAASFTWWAAARSVQILRGNNRSRVEAAREQVWKNHTTTDLASVAASNSLRRLKTTFGKAALSMPPAFEPGLPSAVITDTDGSFFFWRFTP